MPGLVCSHALPAWYMARYLLHAGGSSSPETSHGHCGELHTGALSPARATSSSVQQVPKSCFLPCGVVQQAWKSVRLRRVSVQQVP